MSATLLAHFDTAQDATVTSDRFDSIQCEDKSMWLAVADGRGDVHILHHNAAQQTSLMGCISLPAPVAIVQLGACPSQPTTAVVVVVTADCRVWAFYLQPTGQQFETVDADLEFGCLVPVAVKGPARCQLAGLVAWEYLREYLNMSLNTLVAAGLPQQTDRIAPISLIEMSAAWKGSPVVHTVAIWVARNDLDKLSVAAAGCVVFTTAGDEQSTSSTDIVHCSTRSRTHIESQAELPATQYLVMSSSDGAVSIYPIGTTISPTATTTTEQLPATPIVVANSCSIQFLPALDDRNKEHNNQQYMRRYSVGAASGRLTLAAPVQKAVVLYNGSDNSNAEPQTEGHLPSAVSSCMTASSGIDNVAVHKKQLVYAANGKLKVLPLQDNCFDNLEAVPAAATIPISTSTPITSIALVHSCNDTADAVAVITTGGDVFTMPWPSSSQVEDWQGRPPALEELEQSLVQSIASFVTEEETAAATLKQLDQQLAGISSSIHVLNTLNTSQGLHCTLRPVAQCVESSGSHQPSSLLLQVTLHNNSSITISQGWGITLSARYMDSNNVFKSQYVPLGVIAAGSSWHGSISVPTPSSGRLQLAVLLVRQAPAAVEASQPCPLLLHSTEVNGLHRVSAAATVGTPLKATSLKKAVKEMKFQLAVPKRTFGISPNPDTILQTLSNAGLSSLQGIDAAKVPRAGALTVQNAFLPAVARPSGTRVASVHAPLCLNGDVVSSTVSIKPVPMHPRHAASTYAVFDVYVSSSDTEACLHLHENILQSAAMFSESSRNNNNKQQDSFSGLQIGKQVLLPSELLRKTETVPVSEVAVENALQQVRALKERLMRQRGGGLSDTDVQGTALALRKAIENIPLLLD